MAYDFSGRFRLTMILPALPAGISLAAVRKKLEGPVFQGLTHELVAARLMSMPQSVVSNVCENMQLATHLEFPDSDPELTMAFGKVLFDEIDRVVQELVAKLDTLHLKGLAELRQTAALTLLNAGSDNIKRHNSYLKQSTSLQQAAELAGWVTTYRAQLRFAHGHIVPPDFERKQKIPIDSLFVSPKVSPRNNERTTSVTDVWSLFHEIDRTVLLGDPGGGKSTASNAMAWHAADDKDGPIPFMVILRTVVDLKQSILGHIESGLSAYYQCTPPPGAVEGLLLSGRAIVFFDGLDELIDTSKRRAVTERVELFCTKYPLTRVIVTSRRVGYEEAAMDRSVFEVFELAEFSDENVETYVQNWFVHVDGAAEGRARQLAESFVQESQAVPDLRRNPLMLALMCIIYRGQHWIPRNRPEMYEHCAKLLFEKWDSSREIYVKLKASAHVDGAIKQLAYWMFTTPEAAQGVVESELVREAVAYLEPAFSSLPEAEQAARQFIEFCRGRGWVLTDVGTTASGESLFAFTHRTFMEYFAAFELVRRHNGPENIARTVLPHIAAAEWEIVAQLAVQISDRHFRDGAARLLSTVLTNKRYRSAASRRNIHAFAMRCLGFAHVPVPLARQIAAAFIETMLQPQDTEIIPQQYLLIPELHEPVEQEIFTILSAAITAGDSRRRDTAIEVALHLPTIMTRLHERDTDAAFDAFDRWTELRRRIFEAHRETILANGNATVWFAAWRHGFISLSDLVTEGPFAQTYPLNIFFAEPKYRYIQGGWIEFGPFLPERLLQLGGGTVEEFPMTIAEIDWLNSFIDGLGDPPWISVPRIRVHPFEKRGTLRTEELTTDRGWLLLRLMLITVEAMTYPATASDSRDYYQVLEELGDCRLNCRKLPEWLADAFDQLQPERLELVKAWLTKQVNFVADAED